jgi:hypothetical protein
MSICHIAFLMIFRIRREYFFKHNINSIILVLEAQIVFCVVGTEFLNTSITFIRVTDFKGLLSASTTDL